jgi:hypothetical protein
MEAIDRAIARLESHEEDVNQVGREGLMEESKLVETERKLQHLEVIGLSNLTQKAQLLVLQQSLLVTLDYDMRKSRAQAIRKAHANTFHWIFENQLANGEPITFMNWLENDSGVFWITGKPGSGKTTLMKYLWNQKATHSALQKWCRGERLATASFYFWNSGTVMQRSLDGLLRTILIQVLDQCPEFIPKKFPSRWTMLSITDNRMANQPPWSTRALGLS